MSPSAGIEVITAPWRPAGMGKEQVGVRLYVTNPVWRETLDYLDALLDKDFVYGVEDYDLTVRYATRPQGRIARADGLDGDLYNGSFDIVVDPAQTKDEPYYDYLARHELCHALGLKHPFDGWPVMPQLTVQDTVMAYGRGNTGFSDLDIAALISVNGIEDDAPAIYKFHNKVKGSSFMTASAEEAEFVATQLYDTFSFESTPIAIGDGDIEVYRFYNTHAGVHFYTASAWEVPQDWTVEGLAFYAQTEGAPMYRYYNPEQLSHRYHDVVEDLGAEYIFEGVAFYV